MKILLVYPPYNIEPNPPLGLAYLAATLEKADHDVKIVDMTPLNMKVEEDILQEIRSFQPTVVGISFMTPLVRKAEKIASLVKSVSKNIAVVVGGPHATNRSAELLKNDSIDFVVIGEGEQTLLELVSSIEKNKKNYKKIDGLVFKDRGKVVANKPRAPIENLDEIPFPARHLLPLESYKVTTAGLDSNLPITTVITSRGCPNYCIFCDSHTIFGRKFRFRSAENIITEIEDVIQRYGITQFDFVDDTFTMDKPRVLQFCHLLETKGLNIKWICNARVNTVDFDILKRIKDCGCVRVDFGVESGEQQVINNIRKGITLEQVKTAFKISKSVGIKTMGFFMVGNPLDSKETIDKTLEFIEELDVDYPTFSLTTPYPGTELFQMAKQKGFIRHENWEEYTTTRRDVQNLPVMRTEKLDYGDMLALYKYALKGLARVRFKKAPLRFVSAELKKIHSFGDFVKLTKKGLKLLRA
jgi:radical SAM superfamily enzyme YgiQ (UPF0313 family)